MILTLSGSSYMTDAPIPSSFQWHFARLAPVRPCLSCSGEPSPGHTTPDVLQTRQSRGEDSPTSLDLVATLCLVQHACCSPPMLQGHIARWCSTCCPPGAPGPLLQSCFSAKHPPSLYRWVPGVSSSPRAGRGISVCSASGHSCWPRSAACQHATEWQHNHLAHQSILLFLSHLQIHWGCPLPHQPSH